MLELCVARVGVHRGALAASYVARYAMTMHRLDGKFPTAVEYADDWAIDERTAWRHRAKMQDAIGEDWPAVVEHVAGHIDERTSVRTSIRTAVPARLLTAA